MDFRISAVGREGFSTHEHMYTFYNLASLTSYSDEPCYVHDLSLWREAYWLLSKRAGKPRLWLPKWLLTAMTMRITRGCHCDKCQTCIAKALSKSPFPKNRKAHGRAQPNNNSSLQIPSLSKVGKVLHIKRGPQDQQPQDPQGPQRRSSSPSSHQAAQPHYRSR